MSNRAWVTLATNDSYGLGALVLAHSLRRAGSSHPAVVLITPSVTEPMRDRLRAVFADVVTVDVLDSRDAAHLALLQRPELGITFTKIHCWSLTQYEKCVFLDADTLVIQNCDELFDREELSAAPDVGWPDCFNSGVFVYKPSNETFEQLIKFAQERGSFDGGDQGLLNSFFSDWAHGDINKHLPFLYNVTSAAFYSYLPALKHFGQNLKIIHFIGIAKPWLQQFNWESRTVEAPEHLRELLQLWWDLFVGQVHPQLDVAMGDVHPSPEVPPHDVGHHYVPTVDPESEFPWHHPDAQTKEDPQQAKIHIEEFHDPWEIYRGRIPANTDEALSYQSFSGRVDDHEEMKKYAWGYNPQEFATQHNYQEQTHEQFGNRHHDTQSHHHHHRPEHHWESHSHSHDQSAHIYHYQDPWQIDHHHKDQSHHEQHLHREYHERKQEYIDHSQEHYHHHEPDQFTHTSDNQSHSHSHHSYHDHSHYSDDTPHNDYYTDTNLEKISSHRVDIVHHVRLDHETILSLHKQKEDPNKPSTASELMNGDILSDCESDYYEEIRPRHPYDGFYLRHRATIDAEGRKVCSHEMPPTPTPSPPPDSDLDYSTPDSVLAETRVTDEIEEHSGVAGNLARVVPGALGSQREALDELTRRQGWEAGNIDYMGADSFDNIWAKISQTLSQPRVSPPKQPSPPKEQPPQEVSAPAPVEVAQEAATVDAPASEIAAPQAAVTEAPEEAQAPGEAPAAAPAPSPAEVPVAAPDEPVAVEAAAVVDAPAPVEAAAQVEAPAAEAAKVEASPVAVEAPAAAQPETVAAAEIPATVEAAAAAPAASAETAKAEPPSVEPSDIPATVEAIAPGEAPIPADVPASVETAAAPEVVKDESKTETPVLPPTPPVTPKSTPEATPVSESAPTLETVEVQKEEAPAPAEAAAASAPVEAAAAPAAVEAPAESASASVEAAAPPAPAEAPAELASVEAVTPSAAAVAPAEPASVEAVASPASAQAPADPASVEAAAPPAAAVAPSESAPAPVEAAAPPAAAETIATTAPVEAAAPAAVDAPAVPAPVEAPVVPTPVEAAEVTPVVASEVPAAAEVPKDPEPVVEAKKEEVPVPVEEAKGPEPVVETQKEVPEPVEVPKDPATPASPAPAAVAPASPEASAAKPESTPEKSSEALSLSASTDSPPLANTPSKEESPALPAAKSEERRKAVGKLQLSPPAVADPLPTPDSELEDAAALAQSIIASELRTPTVTGAPTPPAEPRAPAQDERLAVEPPAVPTPPVGVSLEQIGVKPKSKPTTAAQIESSVSDKSEPAAAEAPKDPPKKKVVKKVKKDSTAAAAAATGAEAPVPPPRKKEKKPKEK